MSADVFVTRLDTLVKTAVSSLFAQYGVTLHVWSDGSDQTPNDHDLACSIGFNAPKMQGAVLLTTRREVIESAWPQDLRHHEPTDDDVYDWAGELVNQLLGRVKSGLVPHGVVLDHGTPTVVLGWRIHRAPASTNVARRYSFRADAGSLVLYFDAVLEDGFVLSDPGADHVPPSEVGAVHLF